jgi:hypothetical protein
MTNDTFDTITRSTGTDRRQTMLALGAAGLATTLAGTFGASAKQSAGKKAKKKCKQQKASCVDDVTLFCTQFEEEALQCRTALLPCCDECDVGFGVICTINAFGPA